MSSNKTLMRAEEQKRKEEEKKDIEVDATLRGPLESLFPRFDSSQHTPRSVSADSRSSPSAFNPQTNHTATLFRPPFSRFLKLCDRSSTRPTSLSSAIFRSSIFTASTQTHTHKEKKHRVQQPDLTNGSSDECHMLKPPQIKRSALTSMERECR